jgi:hydroxymethylpyrimidine kinase/phosphomethylpyrimidine kinase/thiamine-phosphate diphosphorylase
MSLTLLSGWDPSLHAGMAADLRVVEGLQTPAFAALSCLTTQDAQRLEGVDALDGQARKLLDFGRRGSADSKARVLKTGLLPSEALWRLAADQVGQKGTLWVCDPVLGSSHGRPMVAPSLFPLIRQCLPHMAVFCPNLLEAGMLLGRTIEGPEQMLEAAREFQTAGCPCILLKGGHDAASAWEVSDLYLGPDGEGWIRLPRLPGQFRGTGCSLASALACGLSWGFSFLEAAVFARACLHQQLVQQVAQATTRLPAARMPETRGCIPSFHPLYAKENPAFPPCAPGFYPIVDSSAWLERLGPLGIPMAQLRLKNRPQGELEAEIARAVALSKRFGFQLFINDAWRLAMRLGAFGVHLGQEDLLDADLPALAAAGLRLGVSTHCYREIARARAIAPSYIALGPVYETTLKKMAFAPLGTATLRRLRACLAEPLVAIGGISLPRASEVLPCGVEGIAVVSAVTAAANPEEAVHQWLGLFSKRKNEPEQRNEQPSQRCLIQQASAQSDLDLAIEDRSGPGSLPDRTPH